jgi:uncharacterized protein YfaS (alpha-2-macroglobulin family)
MHNSILKMIVVVAVAFSVSCASIAKLHLEDGRTVYGKSDQGELKKKDYIEGYIRDSTTKKGIEGATVEIKNINMGVGYYSLTTDSKGYFRIDDFIRHIKYKIEVIADGYVTYTSTERISGGMYDIKLDREGILTGIVKDSSGVPLKGVEVKLIEASGYSYRTSRPITMSTDERGRYRFIKLRESSYVVTFSRERYITETARIKKIMLGEIFKLPMVMVRPSSISGRIIIEEINTPAINVDVTLKGRMTHSTSTYQDGSYILEDIKPGYYKIHIYHRGFYKISSGTIRIREGTKREKLNFVVRPKPPKVSVYSYRYTYSPGMKVAFNLRSFRLEKVKVSIYSVPMDILLTGRTDPNKVVPSSAGFKVFDTWDESVRNFKPYEWRYQLIEVPKALPTGGYCIEVSGADRTYDRKFFTVTSVGIVVKRSRESILAYVTNLVNNKPIEGAHIIVFDNTPQKESYRRSSSPYKPPERIEELPVRIVHKGKTDRRGIFHFRKMTTMHLSVLAISSDRSYAFCSTGHPYEFKSELNKYFIYTDRPVYRAGDTVFYKIIGKRRDRRFRPIVNRRLYYEIKNISLDETVGDGELTLDQWGTFNNRLTLEADTHLGTYEIRVGEDRKNLYGVGRFYVEQYRKPEFKIDITPSRDYFVNGDTAEFKVEAKYFFGAPLKGALLRYRFYETRLRDTDTRYWWEDDYGSTGYYNRIKLEGEKYVDDNGIAVLRLHCGNYPYDREITLEVTAIDKSNVSITSRKSVKVGRGAFYIKINPVKNFFADDEEKKVEIVTLTHGGKPVRRDVTIQLFRYIWKPWQRVYVHDKRPIFERRVSTDAGGRYLLELPKKFDTFGEFDIIATGKDRRENIITASRVVWVYNRYGARIASRFKNLELTVNENRLKKPQEITCLLKSRFTDAYVCLTLEGRDIYDKKVVKMNGNVMPVKLMVKSEYAPNLFISATMQRQRALFTASTEITLPNPDTSLKIAISTDKKSYLPGEKARVDIRVTDEMDKPAIADLSLGSVDESIYLIRRDHTPGMVSFFYSKISNWVMTNYSYPITILAGVSKDKMVKIREKFRDTAYWNPSIRTDRGGRAHLSFTLPDNLTTWRLTVRGHDLKGRVGEKREKFLVTQDLIARVGKPRFMIEGDTLSLIGIVNSNTQRGLKRVDTDFQVDGIKIKPEKEMKISLPPFGSSRSYYQIKVPEDRAGVKVFFKALADREAMDALRINIPVESRGVSFKIYAVGDMAQNKRVVLEPIGNTDDFDFKPTELKISLNPSPIAQMIKATSFLTKYPYGCIEQTINRFVPNLVLKDLLKKKGLENLIEDRELDEKVRAGISRIQGYQNDDGTWGWWYGGRGNEFVTGYVLYSLHTAKRLGFNINMNSVKRGLTAIAKLFSYPQKMDGDAKAYLLYIFALWGEWSNVAFGDLIKEKNLNAYQLAFMIRAMSCSKNIPKLKGEEKNRISKLLPGYIRMLKEMQKRDSRGIYWESSSSQRWRWQGGNTELSAHVLSSLIDAGDRSPLLSQLVGSITKRGRGDAWNSTKETATVFFSLCKYLDEIGGDISGRGSVNFELDGRAVSSISYDAGELKDIKALTRKIKIQDKVVKKSYIVRADGKAGADVSFDLALMGNLYFKEKGLFSFLKSPERSLRELENGIGLVRRFYTITRVRDVNNNEFLVPQDLAGKKMTVGDEILVKVKFRAQDDFEYLVLEDYLPSGFEVINKNPYGEYKPYVHLERWDNRMVYFFTRVRKGTIYEVAYVLRAELPGDFIVKPARMECMYEPSIQGWSAPARFGVERK